MPTVVDRRLLMQGCSAAGVAAFVASGAWAAAEARPVAFADGGRAPRLGLGSWHMASPGAAPETEAVEAMRLGVSLGIDLIDTAELYSEGRAEQMVARVLAGRRDKVFLVSKVMPDHATEDGIEPALRASLTRLGTDHLDLYLLHWRKRHRKRLVDTLLFREGDLRGVVRGFERARPKGLIKRGIEVDLVPWCERHEMPIMAYSPLGAGGKASLLASPVLKQIGATRGVSPAAVALAWAMRNGRTIVVTETSSARHVREDAAAPTLVLGEADLKALDDAFPPPKPS